MKTRLILFAIIAILASCSSDDNESLDATIRVIESSVDFDATGGNGEITLSSAATSVTSNEDWCKVVYDGGNTADLNVSSNPLSDTRHAVITVKDSNGYETKVAVSQAGSILSMDRHDLVFYNNDTTAIVKILSSNVDYEFRVPIGATWLSVNHSGDNIVVNADTNSTGEGRACTVYCYVGGQVKDSITVVQIDDNGIYGDYYITGKSISDAYSYVPNLRRATLEKADADSLIRLSIPEIGFSEEFTYDRTARDIIIPLEQKFGTTVTHLKNTTTEEDSDMPDTWQFIPTGHRGENAYSYNFSGTNESCSLYMSCLNGNIVWRIKNNSSYTEHKVDGLVFTKYYELIFSGSHKGGVYFAVYDLYMIPADKSHPSER